MHLNESERVLRTDEKFQELVQLYQTKGQHKSGTNNNNIITACPLLNIFSLALDMLHKFHKGPYTVLSGVWPTIDYLQNLGCDNIDLILKYSEWVLRESPDDGIKVSTRH